MVHPLSAQIDRKMENGLELEVGIEEGTRLLQKSQGAGHPRALIRLDLLIDILLRLQPLD